MDNVSYVPLWVYDALAVATCSLVGCAQGGAQESTTVSAQQPGAQGGH